MCSVSVIYDMFAPLPDSWYTQERIDLFRRMVKDARLFDLEAGQPDCEDPEKAKVEDRIKKIEDKIEDEECDYRGADCD